MVRTLAALSVLGFTVLLAGCGKKDAAGGDGNPTTGTGTPPAVVPPADASKSGDWTHAELFQYLRDKKGLKFRNRPAPGQVVAWVVFTNSDAEEKEMFDTQERMGGGTDPHDERMVICQKVDPATVDRARDAVGLAPAKRYLWGRFYFKAITGGEKYIDKIKAALK